MFTWQLQFYFFWKRVTFYGGDDLMGQGGRGTFFSSFLDYPELPGLTTLQYPTNILTLNFQTKSTNPDNQPKSTQHIPLQENAPTKDTL